MTRYFRDWFASGEPWIWMNAAAIGISMTAVLGILGLIGVKGFGHFWPTQVSLIEYHAEDGSKAKVFAEKVRIERIPISQYVEAGGSRDILHSEGVTVDRWLIKTGNRKTHPPDFRWLFVDNITATTAPPGVIALERVEWGNAYGIPSNLHIDASGQDITDPVTLAQKLSERVARANRLREQIDALQRGSLDRINFELERNRLAQRKLRNQPNANHDDVKQLAIEAAGLREATKFDEARLSSLYEELNHDTLTILTASNEELSIPVTDILHAWYPNDYHYGDRLSHFFTAIKRFLVEDPREANTEGGIFPAIFGTVLMVLLMSVIVTPVGVVAAIYLHEYAKQGPLVRVFRIAVNNLAGVPSIVYGVFGLGFFVYLVGGNIDRLFYSEALPAPTFGTPGLIWASLTLALLTVPVVIVSTEEGLSRIPRSLREGSLALGATKSETLFNIILPMASPAILTGVILAVARAAGEVAPLMLVGVVKLAPTLPLDGNFPFLHLDRKFMHLGFHIYDVGFQSPNVEAARPLVYATALLLVTIIVALNLAAITLRSRLEKRYRGIDS